MAKQVSGISVSGADKTEKILGIGLIIALVGFFLIMIFQGVDNLVGDLSDDVANFPGLSQLLALFGSLFSLLNKIVTWIITLGGTVGNQGS
jgi:hypothetical protein